MSLAKCEFSKATYLVKVVEQENAHPFRAKVEALEFLPTTTKRQCQCFLGMEFYHEFLKNSLLWFL